MHRLATPRVVFAAAVALVLAVVAVTVIVALTRAGGCRETVAVRDDQRAMWLYLLEQNPDNPRAASFRAELDLRLPKLECVGWLGGHPEPKET